MKWFVDCNARPGGSGDAHSPFRTITQAANVAKAGDEVIVSPGIYREDVNPVNAGTGRDRIIYRSKERRQAVITGADPAKDWKRYDGDVWLLTVHNSYFGAYNPYTTFVSGDWLDITVPVHTGEVFLNDKAMYEKDTLEKVISPKYYEPSWDRDFTKHVWYTCQDNETDSTLIYANFCGADPNEECVEITVRAHCFWPVAEHVGYITLSGFTVTKAATQWAPPTALQEGMIGPHWSKGWIIEDCEVYGSKCSGISLGKYRQQHNDNKWLHYKYKDGAQTQRDCSLIAQLDGWSKETIGSHIVRDCDIHDCGQTGIVGNLGGVFSVIENNHIHHINNKRDLAGAETGGIKLHAAIDVIIRNNHFHDNVRGIWLDWQCQGTRVSSNFFHDNCMAADHLLNDECARGLGLGEDIWIEIAHGPTLVDNNVLLSERSVRLSAQGVAFVHNLFGGSITATGHGVNNGSDKYPSPRYTPIHAPHSTDITGFMTVLHGDVRFYNNVFVQQENRQGMIDLCSHGADEWDDRNLTVGTCVFDGYMKEDTWKDHFKGYCGEGCGIPRDRYYMPLPVWTGGNVFYNGAQPCDIEEDGLVDNDHKVSIKLDDKGGKCTVETDYKQYLPKASLITSDTLGMAFEPEERFEAPDGSDIVFDTDIYGSKREKGIFAGPF